MPFWSWLNQNASSHSLAAAAYSIFGCIKGKHAICCPSSTVWQGGWLVRAFRFYVMLTQGSYCVAGTLSKSFTHNLAQHYWCKVCVMVVCPSDLQKKDHPSNTILFYTINTGEMCINNCSLRAELSTRWFQVAHPSSLDVCKTQSKRQNLANYCLTNWIQNPVPVTHYKLVYSFKT